MQGCLEDKFSVGAQVEVTRDKEIYGAAWFPGRVVKVVGDTYFLVEYENLRPNDNTCTKGNEPLREIVDDQYMRPSPPDTAYVKDFCIQDEVEVLVCGRWLAGVISKIILFGSKYIVKLKYQDLEDGFDISELRLHYDWTDGQWICTSMVCNVVLYFLFMIWFDCVSGLQNSSLGSFASINVILCTSNLESFPL